MRILKVFLFTNKLSSRLAENILLKRILDILEIIKEEKIPIKKIEIE